MSKLRISQQIDIREIGEISQEGSVNAPENPQTIPFSYAALYSRVRNSSLRTTLLCLHLLYRLPESLNSSVKQQKRTWKLCDKDLKYILEPNAEFVSRNKGFQAKVEEHFWSDFERLRTEVKVASADLAISFCPIRNAATMEAHSGNNGGRSTAFIYFTSDRRFIIKTLTHSEVRFIERKIEEMMTYLLGNAGKSSLLARILGVFSLTMRGMEDIHFAIIENVMPTSSLEVLFDLKGSQVHRAVVPPDQPLTLSAKGKVLKDMDFLRVKTAIKLDAEACARFHTQITNDTNFLRSIRSMDYSLLLGLSSSSEVSLPCRALQEADSGAIWYAGIIDYLQEYNVSKHIERVGKLLVNPAGKAEAHSCVNPDVYQERFCEFLASIILS
jgi:1-phosphatidylinositol-4-phosphate 5-kinase